MRFVASNLNLLEFPGSNVSNHLMEEFVEKLRFGRSKREVAFMLSLAFAILLATIWFAFKFVNPAPPSTVVIATGNGEGDYATYAKEYQKLMLKEGIHLQLRNTEGAAENAALIKDPKSDVQVAFVHDGLLTQEEAPDVESLGSMYYEPLWVFVGSHSSASHATRLGQLVGKNIGIGELGSGTMSLALRLLESSGVDTKNAHLVNLHWSEIGAKLKTGELDAAFFIGPPQDELIQTLLEQPEIQLMNMDNAETMQRRLPFLHHLTLPHGSIDIAKNLPDSDINIVAPTATLLVKKSIHPALVDLILRSASRVHSDAGVFERPNEFPSDKDYEIDLNEEARQFYKNGAPSWHRYLPFWLATFLERFVVVALPFFALVIPALKLIPRFFNWRARRKILSCYAELKYMEIKMRKDADNKNVAECMQELVKIEEKVRHLKVPLEFADQLYGLRSNINMVHEQIASAASGILQRS